MLTGDRPQSRTTVLQAHRLLHAAFRQAVRDGLDSNPVDAVEAPSKVKPKLTVPSAEQVRDLTASAEQEGGCFPTMVRLTARTGLRRAELLGLRWSTVELEGDSPHLSVEATLQRAPSDQGRALVLVPPKSETSRRDIPLGAETVMMLRAHRKEQTERRLIAGPAWAPANPEGVEDFVFDRGDGTAYDPDTFTHQWVRTARRAKLSAVRFHDLRHAFATRLIAADVNPKTVSELMGHYSVAFTMETYVHSDDQMKRAAVDALAAYGTD